jgi:hypothetical protein
MADSPGRLARDGGRNPVACGITRGLGNAAADRLLFPAACHLRPLARARAQDVLALAAANPAARRICLRQGPCAKASLAAGRPALAPDARRGGSAGAAMEHQYRA